MKLTAQWALFSKRPGDRDDYRILNASRGSLEPSAYERLVRSYLPGTPAREAADKERPDALPWVWCAPSEQDGAPALGLAVMELGDSKDVGGRRTDPTSYYQLGWTDLAAARPTLSSLVRAIMPHRLPLSAGGPVRITVDGLDHQELARLVEQLGFEKIARAAALLLEGPVALVNAGPLAIDRRLASLDAIAALLPYGFRADLAASTWADPRGQIRLNFGVRARADQRALDWGGEATPPTPGESRTVRYLELLRRLRQRRGTEQIVQHLAATTAACSFEQPDASLEYLLELDRPYAVWQDVVAGRGDPAAVRDLLHSQLDELDDSARGDLVGFLSFQGDMADLPLLERHWTPGAASQLRPVILRLVAESLPSWVIDRYLELAARHGQLDQLLADLLLAAETIESAAQAPSRSRLLDLVRPRVVAPSRTDLPSVRDALRQHPSLVYELLAPPIADGRTNEVAAIVTWLAAGDALSGALRPLQAIQPDGDVADGALGKAELRAVWQLDPNYLRTVLDLACHAGWADLVLPAVWSWLPSLGERLSFDERRGWLATLQRLPPPTVGRGTVLVQLDLLALLLDGRTLRPLDQTLQSDEAADYLEKLPDAINSRQLNQWRPQLLERLASHVRGLAWTQPPTLARHVLHLLRIVNDALTTHSGSALPSNPAAALQIVVDGIVADASILELPAYQGEWRAIIEQSPRHSQQILRAALKRSIEGEALPEALGVACARELVQITDLEIAVDNLVAILRDSAVPWRGEDVERFLDTLRRELRRGGMSPQRVDWVDSVLVDRVLAASLSVTLADSYRHYLARAIPMELARLVSLIGKARVDIPTEALPGLRNAARELDQLAKRRGQGSRFRRSKA